MEIQLDGSSRLVMRVAGTRPGRPFVQSVAMNRSDASAPCAQHGPTLWGIHSSDFVVADPPVISGNAQVARKPRAAGASVVMIRAGDVDQRPARVVNVHEIDEDL